MNNSIRQLFGEVPVAAWIFGISQALVFVIFLARLDNRLDHQEKRLDLTVNYILKQPHTACPELR
jgi:hypothetical protein